MSARPRRAYQLAALAALATPLVVVQVSLPELAEELEAVTCRVYQTACGPSATAERKALRNVHGVLFMVVPSSRL